MLTIKTPEQIQKMREAGKLLASCHKEIAKMIKPGVTPMDIDTFVEYYLDLNGAIPEQKGFHGYPFATCASVNDVVCHGIPNRNPLRNGDVVTIDFVVNLNGWLADSAWSYRVGQVSEKADRLLRVSEKAMYVGIEQAKPGNRVGDIAHAIQTYAEPRGYSIVRDFAGHSIGQQMHEDIMVPHYGRPGHGMRLKEGMVITIEPILTTGSHEVYIEDDGWTARTVDGSLSAQYEHTVAITKDGPLILTSQT